MVGRDTGMREPSSAILHATCVFNLLCHVGIATHGERLKNVHHDFMTAINNAAPLRKRVNNVHHGFMRALETRISFVCVVEKYAQRFMKVIKKCMSFV